MTWARRNLNHFPSIAELRGYIEGDPEEQCQKAWDVLAGLSLAGPEATVILNDAGLPFRRRGDHAGAE
jgi:hypothetical protein